MELLAIRFHASYPATPRYRAVFLTFLALFRGMFAVREPTDRGLDI